MKHVFVFVACVMTSISTMSQVELLEHFNYFHFFLHFICPLHSLLKVILLFGISIEIVSM